MTSCSGALTSALASVSLNGPVGMNALGTLYFSANSERSWGSKPVRHLKVAPQRSLKFQIPAQLAKAQPSTEHAFFCQCP